MAAIKKKVEVDEKKEALINLAYAMEAAKARGDMKEAELMKKMLEDADKEMALRVLIQKETSYDRKN